MKRKYFVFLLVCLLVAATIFVMKVRKKPEPAQQTKSNTVSDQTTFAQKQKDYTLLLATGDFIAHDAINAAAKTSNTYNYKPFMASMKPIMQKAELRFCNQSTLVGGDQFGVSGFPLFNAPLPFIDAMQDVGCNIVNTASNHSSDKTQAVIDANVTSWQQKNMLAVAGQNSSAEQKQKIQYFTQDGIKYAFLAYTTYTNQAPPTAFGVNMYSRDFALNQLNEAKNSGAQFIIVSMRWGTEYSQSINNYQKSEAQFLSDNGASLILGHGPHVLEPVQWLQGTKGNKTLVWYSLGNFLHAQLEAETLFNGVAVIKIDKKTATITDTSFLPTYMHYDWTAQQAAAQDLLSRRNFSLVPLEDAEPLFKTSQLKTTIAAQKERIQKTLNAYTTVPMITTKDIN